MQEESAARLDALLAGSSTEEDSPTDYIGGKNNGTEYEYSVVGYETH